jgi:hypothetical protein
MAPVVALMAQPDETALLSSGTTASLVTGRARPCERIVPHNLRAIVEAQGAALELVLPPPGAVRRA